MEIFVTTIGLIFATYCISAVLAYSGGAWGVLERIREYEPIKRFGLLECVLCVSFWAALILTIIVGGTWWQFFTAWGVTYIVDQVIMAYKTRS